MAQNESGLVAPHVPVFGRGGSRASFHAMTRRLGVVGIASASCLILMALAAAFANIVAWHSPTAVNYEALLQGPSLRHPFGTDEFGRDQLARILYGARISLVVPLGGVILGTVTGGVVGIFSGYAGGLPDAVIQRAGDVLMSFPFLVASLVVVTVLGPSVQNVILTLAIVQFPRSMRIVRSAALSVKSELYVEAARSVGASPMRIVLRHVLPGTIAPAMVAATIALGAMVLAEAAMSFLGLGVPPPQPTWGGMLSGSARNYLDTAPWLMLVPGIAIAVLVLSFNLLGDALRDALDPRLRNR